MLADLNEVNNIRQEFYKAAQKMYPNTGEPGSVWVLTQVLGWDWEDIKRTSVDGFGRHGYKRFLPDRTTVTRTWTREEKRKLSEWWWLLGL